MKNLIRQFCVCSLISIIFIKVATTQEYFPFPQDSAIWYSLKIWPFPDPPPLYEYNTYLEFILGDTLINNMTYNKYYWTLCNDTVWQDNYYGAIRVDIENDKVYFLRSDLDYEVLLYDFTLVPGDTISTLQDDLIICLDTLTVLINEIPHKKLLIDIYIEEIELHYYMTWIKGIGSLRLPHEPSTLEGYGFEHSFELTCFYYKGEQIYNWEENPFFESCEGHYIVSTNEKNENSSIKIVPNPITNKSRLIIPSRINKLCNYMIMNMSGIVLYEKQNILPSEILIEKKYYMPGIYILKIYLIENKKYIIKKIIIN